MDSIIKVLFRREVRPLVFGVKKAVYKSYLLREDAENAFNRTLARNAVHTFANREEAAGGA